MDVIAEAIALTVKEKEQAKDKVLPMIEKLTKKYPLTK